MTKVSMHSYRLILFPLGRSRRTSRESYKSPFDRKREKAIKMLTYQVQKRRDEQKEEKHHLEQFQVSIQEEQLTVVINELRYSPS